MLHSVYKMVSRFTEWYLEKHMPSRTFPVTADSVYHDAFASFAREKGRTIAELVREALDQKYGAELQPHLDFVASRGNHKKQSEPEETKHG